MGVSFNQRGPIDEPNWRGNPLEDPSIQQQIGALDQNWINERIRKANDVADSDAPRSEAELDTLKGRLHHSLDQLRKLNDSLSDIEAHLFGPPGIDRAGDQSSCEPASEPVGQIYVLLRMAGQITTELSRAREIVARLDKRLG